MPGEGAWAQSPPRARPPQRAKVSWSGTRSHPPGPLAFLRGKFSSTALTAPQRVSVNPHSECRTMERAESHVSWLGDSSTARSRRLSGGGMRLSKRYVVREDQLSLTGRAACRIAGSNAVTTSRLLMNESAPLSYASRRVGSWHLGQDPIPTE